MERFLYNNTVLRILALVLACTIWLGVNAPSGAQSIYGGFSQPFSYFVKVETKQGVVATTIAPAFVTVLVSGNSAELSSIASEMTHVTVVADATNLSVGAHVVKLNLVNMPRVAHTINPPAVTLVLKRTAQIP